MDVPGEGYEELWGPNGAVDDADNSGYLDVPAGGVGGDDDDDNCGYMDVPSARGGVSEGDADNGYMDIPAYDSDMDDQDPSAHGGGSNGYLELNPDAIDESPEGACVVA
jgi:hypothetical protein